MQILRVTSTLGTIRACVLKMDHTVTYHGQTKEGRQNKPVQDKMSDPVHFFPVAVDYHYHYHYSLLIYPISCVLVLVWVCMNWKMKWEMGNEEMGMIWNAELIILLSLGLGTNLDMGR